MPSLHTQFLDAVNLLVVDVSYNGVMIFSVDISGQRVSKRDSPLGGLL